MVLGTAYHSSQSTSGFLVMGFGLALFLDRCALGVLAWTPITRKEVIVWVGSFVAGSVAFYLMRPGIVPIWEAAHRGVVVCLVVWFIDVLIRWITPFVGGRRVNLTLRGVALVSVVLLTPMIAALHPLHTIPKRDPSAFGLAFEDIRLQSEDGIELAAWVVPHPHPRGNVIFAHGHGRNRGHVAGLLETFHDLGFNVLAFDFRGHGESAGHTSTFGYREVQDLLAAADYLTARFPDQPLFLVGVSLGAAVSLQALPALPNVRGVWSEGAFARFEHAVNRYFLQVPGFIRPALVDLYFVLAWLDCGMWGPSINPAERAASCANVPILFCHATHDELVPFSEGQLLYETYRGPKACLVGRGRVALQRPAAEPDRVLEPASDLL
jgi:alpha-beta hydrolase superfamily lysophospholipase